MLEFPGPTTWGLFLFLFFYTLSLYALNIPLASNLHLAQTLFFRHICLTTCLILFLLHLYLYLRDISNSTTPKWNYSISPSSNPWTRSAFSLPYLLNHTTFKLVIKTPPEVSFLSLNSHIQSIHQQVQSSFLLPTSIWTLCPSLHLRGAILHHVAIPHK